MPRYYFHLSNKRCVTDPYGTVLIDKDAAMTHALVVARELMFNSSGMVSRGRRPKPHSVAIEKSGRYFFAAVTRRSVPSTPSV